jgi:hypothetical protein
MIARTTPASHALLRCCTLFHRCFRVAESKLAPACIMCTHRTQTTLNLLGFMVMILKQSLIFTRDADADSFPVRCASLCF